MGWLFTHGATRSDVIDELTQERFFSGREFRTLRKCFRGNTMYALHESGPPGELRKWICVYMLQKDSVGWGYKDIAEEMGPYQVDCPVSYLDEADPPAGDAAAEWRKKVREHAAALAKIRPKVGESWRLHEGCRPSEVRITSLRPLRGSAGGYSYKIKRTHLRERIESK